MGVQVVLRHARTEFKEYSLAWEARLKLDEKFFKEYSLAWEGRRTADETTRLCYRTALGYD